MSIERLFNRAAPSSLGEFERPGEWLSKTSALALKADPQRAAAYFIHGWARWFEQAERASVIADLEHAAQLNPAEPLFKESLAFVRKH